MGATTNRLLKNLCHHFPSTRKLQLTLLILIFLQRKKHAGLIILTGVLYLNFVMFLGYFESSWGLNIS